MNALLVRDITDELTRARAKFPRFHSCHEGIAVIQEEVDELWAEVKKGKGLMGNEAMRKEAIQVAAMAVRFLEDLCE